MEERTSSVNSANKKAPGGSQPFGQRHGPTKQFRAPVAQSKNPVSIMRRPATQPVSRPHMNPLVAKAQMTGASPGYLPQNKPVVLQAKNSSAPRTVKVPNAPSVYRPQSLPRVLQKKQFTDAQQYPKPLVRVTSRHSQFATIQRSEQQVGMPLPSPAPVLSQQSQSSASFGISEAAKRSRSRSRDRSGSASDSENERKREASPKPGRKDDDKKNSRRVPKGPSENPYKKQYSNRYDQLEPVMAEGARRSGSGRERKIPAKMGGGIHESAGHRGFEKREGSATRGYAAKQKQESSQPVEGEPTREPVHRTTRGGDGKPTHHNGIEIYNGDRNSIPFDARFKQQFWSTQEKTLQGKYFCIKQKAGCLAAEADGGGDLSVMQIDHREEISKRMSEIPLHEICDGRFHWLVAYKKQAIAIHNDLSNLQPMCQHCNGSKSGQKGIDKCVPQKYGSCPGENCDACDDNACGPDDEE
jgi:hypothetical protein